MKLVVAVVHTPLAVDMELVRNQAADVILSGHDEFLLAFYDGRTVLTESESQANFSVVTTLRIDKSEKDGKISVDWRPSFRIVDTAEETHVLDDSPRAQLVGQLDAVAVWQGDVEDPTVVRIRVDERFGVRARQVDLVAVALQQPNDGAGDRGLIFDEE